MAVISEPHPQVGHIRLVNIISIRPRLPVVLANPMHLYLHSSKASHKASTHHYRRCFLDIVTVTISGVQVPFHQSLLNRDVIAVTVDLLLRSYNTRIESNFVSFHFTKTGRKKPK